jgi:hypothetical protein
LGLGPEPVNPDLAIDRQSTGADERRKFAGSATAGEVHLEEPILRVQKAGGTRRVDAVEGLDGWNAELVARDPDGSLQARQLNATVELREAAAKLAARPHRAAHRGDNQDEQHDYDETENNSHAGRGSVAVQGRS